MRELKGIILTKKSVQLVPLQKNNKMEYALQALASDTSLELVVLTPNLTPFKAIIIFRS